MVGQAREFARRAAADWAVGEGTTATVELLVSELVTNSVCHTAGDHVQVWVRLRGRLLFIEVHDGGPAWRLRASLPDLDAENGGAVRRLRARPPDLEAENGRGLLLVNALALRWGRRRHRGGTRTWACVAVPISQPRFK
ncbi:ATP-binding protein [Streptosporangium sp. NBC_01755]|uniref:ATP-binding protein n=1 Tax=Streptosporangium sp. NBC_01755 TaxID=2975949 RepID=UPI002DDC4639|nr:ATP-binding protein [Streptosporangium sp. NBC_01755]WSD02518.1 ATP-binding protein [Streptosporangium sp. NBC_01755]